MAMIAVLEGLEDAKSRIDFLRAHANMAGEEFSGLLLALCADGLCRADDNELMEAIDDWPDESTLQSSVVMSSTPAEEARRTHGSIIGVLAS